MATQQNLRNTVQLTSIGHVTRSQLLSKHHQQLNNGQNNSDKLQDIVDILGGIDVILLNYLSSQDISMTNTEIEKLNVIITSKNDNNSPQKNISYYYFKKTNSFLHSWFGPQIGHKLFNLIYNKYCLIFISILAMINSIWWYLSNDTIFYLIFSAIFFPMGMLFNLMVILSVNRVAFYHIIRGFEFWLKVLYSIQFGVAVTIYYFIFINKTVWSNHCIADYMVPILVTSLIVIYSLLDGIETKLLFKVMFGGFQCIVWIQNAYKYSFIDNVNGEKGLIKITNQFSISLFSLLGASARILCIFIVKQTVINIIYPNKCVNIKDNPFVKWIHQTDDSYNHDTDTDNSQNIDIDDDAVSDSQRS